MMIMILSYDYESIIRYNLPHQINVQKEKAACTEKIENTNQNRKGQICFTISFTMFMYFFYHDNIACMADFLP